MARIAPLDRARHLPFELGQGGAGQRLDVPRLEIAAGCRARRTLDQLGDDRGVDRLIEEGPAAEPGLHGCENIHMGVR